MKHHRRLIRRLRARHAAHGRTVTARLKRTSEGWELVVREASEERCYVCVYVRTKRLNTIKAAMRDA